MIRVIYRDNSCGTVKCHQLENLLKADKIVAFCRSDGWVTVGRDPIRGLGGSYHGPDRREYLLPSKPSYSHLASLSSWKENLSANNLK